MVCADHALAAPHPQARFETKTESIGRAVSVSRKTPHLLKERPCFGVVLFPVAPVEGGVVVDGPLHGPAGLGVVYEGVGNNPFLHVADAFPPEGGACFFAQDAVGRVSGSFLAWQAAFATLWGEDDASFLIIPSVFFI